MPAVDPESLELARLLARRKARFAKHLADDLESEALLAACEYAGDPGGLGTFMEGRLRALVRGELAGEVTHHLADRTLAELDVRRPADLATAPAPPGEAMTPGQKRRHRRNVVIAAARRQGCSQNLLAEVFGLPRSWVQEILREMDGKTAKVKRCS